MFKDFVKQQRPIVDLDAVATGEHWLGTRAHALQLVDEIRTSDDYLMSLRETADIFEVEYSIKKKMFDRLSGLIGRLRGNSLFAQDSQSITRMT